MTKRTTITTDDGELELTASRWLARLDRGNLSDEERRAFEAWRDTDRRHAAAYERITAVWHHLDRLTALRIDADESLDPDVLAPNNATRAPRARPNWLPRWWGWVPARPWGAAATLGAVLCATVVALTFLDNPPSREPREATTARPITEHYVTAIGGHERIALKDGSVLELNTDTEAFVSLGPLERHIELLRGEALFEVAVERRRPFVVSVNALELRAIGTLFSVKRTKEGVEILVVEGTVSVGDVLVHAGERARRTPEGITIERVPAEPLQRALAWRKGMLAFDDVALIDAAREFNRYNARRLVIADPEIAQLRIGGYFRAANIEGFVRVLENHFAVHATRKATEIQLRRAPEKDKEIEKQR